MWFPISYIPEPLTDTMIPMGYMVLFQHIELIPAAPVIKNSITGAICKVKKNVLSYFNLCDFIALGLESPFVDGLGPSCLIESLQYKRVNNKS
jgi:hypothetical protein